MHAATDLHPSSSNAWYTTLAAKLSIPLVNPAAHPCDARLLSRAHMPDYLRRNYLPWRIVQKTLVIATNNPSRSLKTYCQRRYGLPVMLVFMTPRDIRASLERQFGAAILRQCLEQIRLKQPQFSAYTTFSWRQSLAFATILTSIIAAAAIAPSIVLLAIVCVMNLLYLTTLGFRLCLLRSHYSAPASPATALPLPHDDALPLYSILVPMYREEEGVTRILTALRALDYPAHKLDIKLVIEADDDATWNAIRRAKPEAHFDVIKVPPCEPRTKPKACSYALHFVRGEYLTIYDAEDQPEPNQLKKAVAAFRHAPANVACFQARLNYYNRNENWLTRCFAIEYASLFDISLPALERLGIPIPLGGTSNHIRVKTLRALYDWDPFNVTEDADLGIRLAMNGYHTRMLDSITLEEATIAFKPWINQRSRWIKGYFQTWLVYMRRPSQTLHLLGTRAFIGFQLIIGLPCLVFLLSPLMWLLSLFWLAGLLPAAAAIDSLLGMSIGIFVLGYGCHYAYARRCTQLWRWHSRARSTCLSYPFYWFCHSLAALKAFWQLLFRPHYWEKTPHVQSRHQPPLTSMAQ